MKHKLVAVFFGFSAGLMFALFGTTSIANAESSQQLNDFRIRNYTIVYHLDSNDQGRSILRTEEKISAQFSSKDSNHGIERAIPNTYKGHSVGLKVISVQNNAGDAIAHTTRQSGGNTVVRIGDKNRYVHGIQHYRLIYEQHDVTHFAHDTNKDEFYWNTNGTQWRVPIDRLEVTINFSKALLKKQPLALATACYSGSYRATAHCQLHKVSDTQYTVAQSNLKPGENVTVAFGFSPKTFAPYQMPLGERIASYFPVVLTGISLLTLVWMIALALTTGKGAKGRGTIVPEYLPPKDMSILESATLLNKRQQSLSAQYISLAVRHVIQIIESSEKGFLGTKKTSYRLRLKRLDELKGDDKKIITILFGDSPSVGDEYTIVNDDYTRGKKLSQLYKSVFGRMKADGYFTKQPKISRVALGVSLSVMAVLIASIFVMGAFDILQNSNVPAFMAPIIIMTIITIIIFSRMRPLTDKGATAKDYLEGLKMYMQLAEKERLKVLQSPSSADKKPVVTTNQDGSLRHDQVVALYERVLPYAVLMGVEKEWVQQLGAYYQEAPEWYAGQGNFSAAMLASSIGSFSATSSAASYSTPSSSSSGGSGGGGFSGGGGGGGGGGGW